MSMGWDYVSERLSPTGLFIIYPQGDTWAWWTMVMMMPAGEKSWLVQQSWQSNQQSSGSKEEEEWTKEWAFFLSVSEILQGIFNMP
jgi:hypothetical protein